MRNLRLPEFNKNRNVNQQKALVFQSETCKYDIILGADFLTKTGIDVKYSTGTMCVCCVLTWALAREDLFAILGAFKPRCMDPPHLAS
jgi:hypothetical protein